MHMNKRGQALVEFIIVLPVFILLIFGFIDFGKIIYVKNEISNILPDVKEMYEKGKDNEDIKNFVKKNNKDNVLEITKDETLVTFKVYRKMSLITPGLGIVMDNPYKVESSLVIEDEK